MKRVFITLSFILCMNIVAFSQTLLLEPQSSVEMVKRYLSNGKFSDSISVCTTYLYDNGVVRKYKTYVTADLNNYLLPDENVADSEKGVGNVGVVWYGGGTGRDCIDSWVCYLFCFTGYKDNIFL